MWTSWRQGTSLLQPRSRTPKCGTIAFRCANVHPVFFSLWQDDTLLCIYIYLHMRCTHIDLNNISSQLHKYAHVIVMIIAIHHNHNCHSILFCYHSYWHDYQSRIHGYHLTSTSVEASIKSAEKKTQGLLEHIYNGSTMHKYNYSPSRQHLDHSFSSKFNFSPFFFPSKNLQIFLFFCVLLTIQIQLHRVFFVAGNSKRSRRFFWVQKDELCWGRAKSDAEVQNVNLKECLGIVYGTSALGQMDLF